MSSRETYGELLSVLVDTMAKYEDRSDVFRKNDIPKGHYYNVINPDKTSSAGNPYHCPTEWGVRLTKSSGDYSWIKAVASDCDCLVLTPDDIEELKSSNPEAALDLFQKILGRVKGVRHGR
jgi:hypothetical protein